jgi:hypothetical protein
MAKNRKIPSVVDPADFSQETQLRIEGDNHLLYLISDAADSLSVEVAARIAADLNLQNQVTQQNQTLLTHNEAIVELQVAFEDTQAASTITITCSNAVQPDMLVYIDTVDGIAKPALASSINTMPAKFYVTSKPTSTTCSVTKDILKAVPNDTLAGKTLFVSETVAGGIQVTAPTGVGRVLQSVGEGLFGSKRFYSISDRVTLRA